MLIDRVLECGISTQMLPCFARIRLFKCFVEPHLRAAFIIFVLTLCKSLGSLSKIGGSLGMCATAIEQFTHLVSAD